MPRTKSKKRAQGRPVANVVGREAILEVAKNLLHDLPPARVTISAIAREARVDPALIRYYFGNRDTLLLAVVDLMLAGVPHHAPPGADPVAAMERRIRATLAFTRSAKQMNRLMIDELAGSKSPQVRERQRSMNMAAVEAVGELMSGDRGSRLNAVDPLFLHLALIGIFDFYVLAQPLIRNLVPEGTDLEKLAHRFEDFVVKLVMEGLKKR